jgi:hypothetical protein
MSLWPDANPNAYCDGDSDSNGDSNTDRNRNTNTYRYGDSDGDAYSNTSAERNSESKSNTAASSDSSASPNAGRIGLRPFKKCGNRKIAIDYAKFFSRSHSIQMSLFSEQAETSS